MVLPLVRRRACAVSIAATLGTALVLGAATGAGAESLEYDLATTAFTSSADYTQPGFSPAETHDGNIEAAAPPYDGWAVDPFQGDPHQILWAFVAGETSVDAIQLIHVYDDNEVLHHFQLYYTTDSNPTLASTFQELTGLQMVLNTSGDGATIAGSEVQVTSTGAITTGEYRLSFDTVTATAIELRTFENSGTGNGNFVLSEISIRSSSPCANVTCSASDQCHAVGSCEPTTGLCTDPALADGTFCDDGDPTTTSDQCTAGVCGSVSLSTISYVFVSDINGDGIATNDGIPAMGSVTLNGVNTSDLSDVSNVTLGAWEYSLIHGGTGEIVSYSSGDPSAVASFNTDLMVITANSLSFDLAAIAVSPGAALYLRSGASVGLSILTTHSSSSGGVVLEIFSPADQVDVSDYYPPIGLLEFAVVPDPSTFVETFEGLGPTLGDDAVLDTIVFGTTTASLRAGSDASDLSGTPGAELYLARVGLPQTSHGNNLHGPDSHQDAHPGNLWFLTDRLVDLQSGNPSFRSFLFGFDEEIAGFELDLYDWTANSPAFEATLTLFDDVGATNVQDSFVQPAAVHTGNDGIVHTLSVQGTGRFVALTFSGGGDNGIGVDNLRVTPLLSTPPSVPFSGPMGPMILALALSTIGTWVVHRRRHRAASRCGGPRRDLT